MTAAAVNRSMKPPSANQRSLLLGALTAMTLGLQVSPGLAAPLLHPRPPLKWQAIRPIPRLGHRNWLKRSVGWGAGERLTYSVKIAQVHAGRAALSVGQVSSRQNSKSLYIRGLGETIPFISSFMRIKEDVVTLIDLAGLYPLQSTSDLTSGAKSRFRKTAFGPVIHHTTRRGQQTLHSQQRIAPPVFDPLSALFWLRSLPLRKGASFGLKVLSGTNLYQVQLLVTGGGASMVCPLGMTKNNSH